VNILIIGDDGRGKALQEVLSRGERVEKVFIRPVPSSNRYGALVQAALALRVGLVVVGPEEPLVGGIVDFFRQKARSISIFGPSRLAAELEGSKIYMKTRCKRWGIPTANFTFVGSYPLAERDIKATGFRIIKADGLCRGKGVRVTKSEEEALAAAHEILVGRVYGDAGSKIVIEERLEGSECSVMALCDGKEARLLPAVRDYKRVSADSDVMTGGMGAYSPLPDVSDAVLATIKKQIIDTLIEGMAREGRPFQGLLFVGIMLTKEGPKLLEVNARWGDPETQTLLARLDSDLAPSLRACTVLGGLSRVKLLRWKKSAAVCVYIADEGYPTSGHRLENVVGIGPTVADAREDAYRQVRSRWSDSKIYRHDIAAGV
jgi:phosphoribosylamine--glycine ligase